jgi:hypothetical protein
MAEAHWVRFRARNGVSVKTADDWRVVGRPHVTWRESTTNKSQPTRQTFLYVPLRSFGCPGDPFSSGGYNNLLHFVHKLLHPTPTAPKSCTLFTKCLQTVAHRRKTEFDRPDPFSPFPYQVREQMQAPQCSAVVLFPRCQARAVYNPLLQQICVPKCLCHSLTN